MKVVALVSGGKDSCYNMMQCIAAGHSIAALANLEPETNTELDSYMYQSVGYEAIDLIAQAMEVPLFKRKTHGNSSQRDKDYKPTEGDEVEDLYQLLNHVKENIDVEGVSVGAILSDYQRIRVENVCVRLNLIPLAYLWQRDQQELLDEMIKCEVDAIVIKVAALGLDPTKHLGRSLSLLQPQLNTLHEKYGLNICGEGGEYETLTIDCPLFTSRIVIEESETIIHSNDAIAPVAYLKFNKLRLETKLPELSLSQRLANLPLKDCDGYITDQNSDSFESIDGEAILSENSQTIQDVCSISMFISSMNQYADLNKWYCSTFTHANPPTRACVQVPSDSRSPIIMEAVSWSQPLDVSGDRLVERYTMHVQSRSHWAPANIGPYSQIIRIGDLINVAGQIGIVPGSLELIKGGIKPQCHLAVRHIERLLKAVDPTLEVRDLVVQGICYLKAGSHVACARKQWEEKTKNAIVDYVVVTDLPKSALVEWHVWAHRHNNQFEYEEKGKATNGWLIYVYRRWNYENNVTAIVCHISSREREFLTNDIIFEALDHALQKLNQGHENITDSLCNLKIFYPVDKNIEMDQCKDYLKRLSNDIPLVFTIIPVVCLQNKHMFMSICGVKCQ